MTLCENCFNKKTGYVCEHCGYDGQQPLDKSILRPGTTIKNKYIVGRVLGRGGFGVSYLAYDNILMTKVCIKEYFPAAISTRNLDTTFVIPYTGEAESNFTYGKSKFVDEGRTLAKFNSNPNIVTVFDFFEANGTAYIVMEYLDGIDLGDYLNKQPNRRLGWRETLELLIPVLSALSEVHKQGVVHRDISPDNIFITTDNYVKLLDFGAARYAMGEQAKSMSVILKHGYAPFEQYSRNAQQGPWTDIYAFCATIYRCLTGVKPPDSTDRIEDDLIVLPSKLGSDIPDYAEDAIMKGLSVRYQNRFQSIENLIDALNGKGYQSSVRPQSPNPRTTVLETTPPVSEKSNKKIIVGLLAAMGVLILVIFVVILAFSGDKADEQVVASNSTTNSAQVIVPKADTDEQADNNKKDESTSSANSIKPTFTNVQPNGPSSNTGIEEDGGSAQAQNPASELTPEPDPTPAPIKENARWNVSVSSYLIPKDPTKYNYSVKRLVDNDILTCWIPGNNRNGIGEYIMLDVNNGDEAYFTGVNIFAGYGKPNRYKTNLRAKNVSVYLDGQYYDDYDLRDIPQMQTIDFYDEVSASSVKIVFNSYYDCENVDGVNSYDDLCISEIGINGYVLK